ncbi:MAG: hypothetical protein QGH60_24445, partial [Phycisphaerae bacterium]|nr:hypothetical protein [Phycisphaerae bacterium]
RILSGEVVKRDGPANYGWPVRFSRGLRRLGVLLTYSKEVTTVNRALPEKSACHRLVSACRCANSDKSSLGEFNLWEI